MLFYNTTCMSSLTFYQCAAEIGAKSTVGLDTGTHRDALQMAPEDTELGIFQPQSR